MSVIKINPAVMIILLTVIAMCQTIQAREGYYRYPTQHEDQLVFASEGDLWRLNAGQTQAVRLTTHPQEEHTPYFSKNGQWLAFMASYDGPSQVYVMPATGGAPKQITATGGTLRGWTDDDRLIITMMRDTGIMDRVVALIDPQSMAKEVLPLLNATNATFADENTIYFSRYGLETSADNSRMYRGGTMSQLWRWQRGDQEAVQLAPDFAAPIKTPMWINDRVWFVSDQSGYDNLWSVNGDGTDPQQHTQYQQFGIRSVQASGTNILYQLGADIVRYSVTDGSTQTYDISLMSDLDRQRTRWVNDPMNHLTSAIIAPQDKRVVLTARGKVAIASAGPVRRVELNIPTTARARSAILSADGKSIYVLIDDNEQGEIWRFASNGKGRGTPLTKDSDARIWQLDISPDGRWLVYHDNQRRLWLMNLATQKTKVIDVDTTPGDSGFSGFSWSSTSELLAYQSGVADLRSQITLYDVKTDRKVNLTPAKYSSYSPVFSTDDRWLYFLSERHFATEDSVWRDRMMGPSFHKRGKIYALALDASARFPFSEDTELNPEDKAKETNKKPVQITWQGLSDRLYEVPIEADDYAQLTMTKTHLLVLTGGGNNQGKLEAIELKNKDIKAQTINEQIQQFSLSADRKFMLLVKEGPGNLFLIDTTTAPIKELAKAKIRTGDWRLEINPTAEWQQMFLDAWRMHRDFSYDKNMRGVDWGAVKDKLLPLLNRVGDRTELDDVFQQMAYELGILHSQVRGGDFNRDMNSASDAYLGALFEPVKNGMRLTHIYRGEAHLVEERGPLSGPEQDVRIGDILTHVNGTQVATQTELQKALDNQAGQQVLLTFKRKRKSHDVIAKPVNFSANRALRYNDWVETRKDYVADRANEIGYLHIRAMGGRDAANFARDFFDVVNKDGLIIDVRANRGGNIDSWLLSALLRKVWAFWNFNASPYPYGNMQQTFRGHVVVLMDQYTYSDGETFSAGFKALDLGHSIGTRTAGAGIWLSGRNRLTDTGMVRIAESAQYDMDGNFLIEGWGTTPKQVVINMPVAHFNGEDAQLDAAISHLKAQIAREPIPEMKPKQLPAIGTPGKDIQ